MRRAATSASSSDTSAPSPIAAKNDRRASTCSADSPAVLTMPATPPTTCPPASVSGPIAMKPSPGPGDGPAQRCLRCRAAACSPRRGEPTNDGPRLSSIQLLATQRSVLRQRRLALAAIDQVRAQGVVTGEDRRAQQRAQRAVALAHGDRHRLDQQPVEDLVREHGLAREGAPQRQVLLQVEGDVVAFPTRARDQVPVGGHQRQHVELARHERVAQGCRDQRRVARRGDVEQLAALRELRQPHLNEAGAVLEAAGHRIQPFLGAGTRQTDDVTFDEPLGHQRPKSERKQNGEKKIEAEAFPHTGEPPFARRLVLRNRILTRH